MEEEAVVHVPARAAPKTAAKKADDDSSEEDDDSEEPLDDEKPFLVRVLGKLPIGTKKGCWC